MCVEQWPLGNLIFPSELGFYPIWYVNKHLLHIWNLKARICFQKCTRHLGMTHIETQINSFGENVSFRAEICLVFTAPGFVQGCLESKICHLRIPIVFRTKGQIRDQFPLRVWIFECYSLFLHLFSYQYKNALWHQEGQQAFITMSLGGDREGTTHTHLNHFKLPSPSMHFLL